MNQFLLILSSLIFTSCAPLTAVVTSYRAGEIGIQTYDAMNQKQLYIYNHFNEPLKFAIHFRLNNKWFTRAWYRIQPGEKRLIFNEPIESTIIYLHTSNLRDRAITPDQGFARIVQGKMRPFRLYDLETVYGEATIELHP